MEPSNSGNPSNPATSPSPSDSPNPAPWYGETHKPLIEAKGWKSPDDVITSYTNLEKLLGADRAGRTVVLPKDENDTEALKVFRAKIGVPERPEDYELPMPTDDSGEFAKAAAKWAHEAGLPKAAAQKFVGNLNSWFEELLKNEQAEAAANSQRELDALKLEWGADYDKRAELARRGARTIGAKAGLNNDDIEVLEHALGTGKMLRLFAALGATGAEHQFVTGDDQSGFGMTPAQARQKLDEMRAKRLKNEITEGDWIKALDRYGPIASKAA